jgi:hypothetical protein
MQSRDCATAYHKTIHPWPKAKAQSLCVSKEPLKVVVIQQRPSRNKEVFLPEYPLSFEQFASAFV